MAKIKWNRQVLEDNSKEYTVEGFEGTDGKGNNTSRVIKFTGRNSGNYGYYIFHAGDYRVSDTLKEAKIMLEVLLGL